MCLKPKVYCVKRASSSQLMTSAKSFFTAQRCKVYSPDGRESFLKAVRELHTTDDVPRVAIYTCGGYIFLIGCKATRFFFIDTHSIGKKLGGNGNGMIKVFPTGDDHSAKRLCWLRSSGVDGKQFQSLSVAQLIG